jgi:hypothetical protein
MNWIDKLIFNESLFNTSLAYRAYCYSCWITPIEPYRVFWFIGGISIIGSLFCVVAAIVGAS